MSIEEYLEKNLDKEYKSYPDSRVYVSSSFHPFKYNNKIYCTGSIRVDNVKYDFITDYTRDGCIRKYLPNAVYYEIKYRSELLPVINRANAFFTHILITAEFSNTKTELVLLRILINEIHKLTFIPIKDRNYWEVWIKELYWNRKRVINKWYIDCVLPF